MSAVAEMTRALRGALLLAMGRTDGLGGFGNDRRAVLLSFAAAALCLPATLMLDMLEWTQHRWPSAPAHAIAVETLGFVIGWCAFLLACRPVLAWLGRLGAWPRLVVVSNWASVVQQVLWLLAALPDLLVRGSLVAEAVGVFTLGWTLWIEWFAFRVVLSLDPFALAALVALDLIIGIAVETTASSLIR